MSKYKHLLFDLDGTLWDFERNSREAFIDIFEEFNLGKLNTHFESFEQIYHKQNDLLWQSYREGKVEKEVLRWMRFHLTLKEFGIDDRSLAERIDQAYITLSPQKTWLLPFTQEILQYLHPGYPLHIVTNGFNEVQFTKLRNAKLNDFFTHVITSEMAGSMKPNPDFFSFTLKTIEAREKDCLIIGDNFQVDIEGAMKIGMDQVFFNPSEKESLSDPTFTIKSLLELKEIL